MREIKFRAWDGKKYLYLSNADFEIAYCGVQVYAEFGGSRRVECVLEQFTGLCDKNGKEIYEGDIIQDSTFKDRGSYIMAVEWEKEAASFVLTRNGWAFRHYFYESSNPDDCEVIGNIHENPELLK